MKYPVGISMTLTSRDKMGLARVVSELIEHGGVSFQWDLTLRETFEEYSLSVDLTGEDWFETLHKILSETGHSECMPRLVCETCEEPWGSNPNCHVCFNDLMCK